MTARNPHPNAKAKAKPVPARTTPSSSNPAAPASVATTIATGSTGPGVPDKAGAAGTAAVHDMVGVALLILPSDVRAAIGDQHLLSNTLELQSKEIVVIVREEGLVAYIRLPIVVKAMEQPDTELRSGMVLHDITGAPARNREKGQGESSARTESKAKTKAKPQGRKA